MRYGMGVFQKGRTIRWGCGMGVWDGERRNLYTEPGFFLYGWYFVRRGCVIYVMGVRAIPGSGLFVRLVWTLSRVRVQYLRAV